MKKILLIFGALLALLLIVILSLPFIIDLNTYRDEIKQEIEKKIHGSVNVESLKLKGLGIEIKNLSLTSKGDFRNKDLLSVGETRIKISFRSLLTGSPRATVVLKKPRITIVKNQYGTLNLLSLVKKGPEQQEEISQSQMSAPDNIGKAIPGMVLNAKLSFLAKEASLKYVDEKTDSMSSVENLNVSLKNISFHDPIDYSISALLSTGSGKRSFFEGKFSSEGKAKVLLSNTRHISGFQWNSKLSLGEFMADVEGKISDFETLDTDLTVKTPHLSLAKLKNSFTPLKNHSVDGVFYANGSLKGKLRDFNHCRVNATLHLELKSRQTDFTFKTTVKNTLNNLESEFVAQSSLLNMDELLSVEKSLVTLASPLPIFFGEHSAEASPATPQNPFEGLRKSPIFQGLTAHGKLSLKKIIFRKSEMTDLKGTIDLERLTASFSRFGVSAFHGKIGMKGTFQLGTPQPAYTFTTVAQGLQLNSILTMSSPNLKDVATGTLNANLNLNGEGLSLEMVKQHLRGKGNIELKEAEVKGLNMGKSLQQELKLISIFSGSKALEDNFTGKIDSLKSTLLIQQGKLYTPDAALEAPGYKALLKGYASFEKEINYEGKILLPAKKFESRAITSLADAHGMVGFPFKLQGVLPKFTFSVDASEIVRMATRAVFQESVKEKVKEKTGIDFPIELPF